MALPLFNRPYRNGAHPPAYLGEFEWRFNNRVNPYLFRDTLTLVSADALPYKELIA
jgi:hypothetical protein